MNRGEAFERGMHAGYAGLRVECNPYRRVTWRRAWVDGWRVGAAVVASRGAAAERASGSREQTGVRDG